MYTLFWSLGIISVSLNRQFIMGNIMAIHYAFDIRFRPISVKSFVPSVELTES
jgi:hypothetical protein